MTDTNQAADVPLETFQAYMWDDLVALFPEDFVEHANDTIGASSKVSFGDAEHTLIKGTLALRILYDAWETYDGDADDDAGKVFSRLPSLVNSLVALRG